MIRALVEADWDRWKSPPAISRQKRDALFELACRIALIAERARESDGATLAADAKAERRRTLRYGLELLAEGADAERLDQAYELSPVFQELDPGTRLELAMVRFGLESIAEGEHPFFAFRRMTAFLGPDYFEKSGTWLLGRSRRKRRPAQSVLIPGELPDLIRSLSLDPRALERALHGAGRGLAVAALSGCPQESLDLAAGFYGKIGAAAFLDDAAYLRKRLSGDEIAQAQAAFMEVVRALEEGGELELGDEDEFATDPAYIKELTRAVMALDDKTLKLVFKEGESRRLALAMQGMEPRAHDRILGLLSKRDMRRVLDAIDDAAILPQREVLAAGRTFAVRALEAAARAKSSAREAIESLGLIRGWADTKPPVPEPVASSLPAAEEPAPEKTTPR